MSPIYLDMEQGSQAWHEARLGIPTASCFKRLLTPAGKLSKSTGPYMAELLSEQFSGEPWVKLRKRVDGVGQEARGRRAVLVRI